MKDHFHLNSINCTLIITKQAGILRLLHGGWAVKIIPSTPPYRCGPLSNAYHTQLHLQSAAFVQHSALHTLSRLIHDVSKACLYSDGQ